MVTNVFKYSPAGIVQFVQIHLDDQNEQNMEQNVPCIEESDPLFRFEFY